jgi:hypothetical protein
MGEISFGYGAVPVASIFWNQNDVTWLELEFLIVGGDESAAMGGDQDLVTGMAMRSIASALMKRNRGDAKHFRILVGDEILNLDRSLNEDGIGTRFPSARILNDPFEHENTLLDD